jgi:hypothetical protein
MLAARFGLGRGSIHRHSRNCIRLRRRVADENRAKADEKRRVLTGDVESAYKTALARLAKAEEAGDLHLILRAQAAASKLLSLRSKYAPTPRPEITGSPLPSRRWKNQFFKSVVVGLPCPPGESIGSFHHASAEEVASADLVYELRWVTRRRMGDRFAERDSPAEVPAEAGDNIPDADLNS